MVTVTDLAVQNKLCFRRGTYNIIDCGIRTGKTYWAVNNLQTFTRDNSLNRVLYLVDTTALKDQIIKDYGDTCADADTFWENPSSWGESIEKIGIMCYQRLGQYVIQGHLEFLENIDVICWDECDSIFDFAAQAFAKARKTDFARKQDSWHQEISNSEILNVIQKYSSKKEYMPLILLGAWEDIVQDNRILCIGLSASPERAQTYYSSLVSASNEGKLQTGYRMAADIYFTNIIDHVKKLSPAPNKGYWCYSPFIEPNRGIVEAARDRGFKAIEIHSPNNLDKPMTEDQLRVYNSIIATGMIPYEYDFVVVNKALARGININDRRFDTVIIDSYDATDRIQAARQTFEFQRHLKIFASPIPDEYLNRWLTIPECRELAEFMRVPSLSKGSSYMTWNSLRECLPAIGYKVDQRKRTIGGKQQQMCYITGEWHDVEMKDNAFLALAEAKAE